MVAEFEASASSICDKASHISTMLGIFPVETNQAPCFHPCARKESLAPSKKSKRKWLDFWWGGTYQTSGTTDTTSSSRDFCFQSAFLYLSEGIFPLYPCIFTHFFLEILLFVLVARSGELLSRHQCFPGLQHARPGREFTIWLAILWNQKKIWAWPDLIKWARDL